MRYLGGKSRLAKKFAPILIDSLDRTEGLFLEPFVGGFNVVPAIYDHIELGLCVDLHPGLCTMYQALQDGWIPPGKVSEDLYGFCKDIRDWEDPDTTFIAFGCSFAGIEFGSYARDKQNSNYADIAKRSIERKSVFMNKITFQCLNYVDCAKDLKSKHTIYCDPPYRNTARYEVNIKDPFDHEKFDLWCEDLVDEGHEVFVSEFSAPDHWQVLWSIDRSVSVSKDAKYAIKQDRLYQVVPRADTWLYAAVPHADAWLYR